MKTAVIIIDFGNFENTRECLLSLHQCQIKEPTVVYVVGQEDRVSELFPGSDSLGVVYVPMAINGGFAYANNIGIKQALNEGAGAVVLLNNDTTVKDDFLPHLLEAISPPTVGMVSPLIYFAPGCEFHHDSYTKAERGQVVWYGGGIIDWKNMEGYHFGVDEVDHGQFGTSHEMDFATGCCVALTRQTIERVGLMKEEYFLYYEDLEWSLRAKRYGLTCMIEPKSVVWHKNAGSTGGSGSKLHTYYQHRNRIVFGLRHAPLRTKLALIKSYLTRYPKADQGLQMAIRDGLMMKMGKNKRL
jgi:GT2 family glycosyltransferase